MMAETTYRNRRAFTLENSDLRVTMLVEGGHLAELTHKASGVNPLWTPPWPSIEPSTFNPSRHGETYGTHAESKLLAGIMGHNLCTDIFGGPSPEETAAGLTPHGEGSIVPYKIEITNNELIAKAHFPLAQLDFERRIKLHGPVAVITESLTNLTPIDKPTAWTQHVTLGPPFLEKGKTQFRTHATRSRVYETDFAGDAGRYQPGADFDWPNVPLKQGGSLDLRVMPGFDVSGGLTSHLLDPRREQAFFLAFSPTANLIAGYAWKRTDFPFLAIWEENHGRTIAPWNGKTLTRGMEFGASPMPESRRQMIERGSLFGVPGFRWIPAKSKASVTYCAFITPANQISDDMEWSGEDKLRFRRTGQ